MITIRNTIGKTYHAMAMFDVVCATDSIYPVVSTVEVSLQTIK